jgi:hypothetical protein
VCPFIDQEDVAQGIELVGQAGDLAVSAKGLERLVLPERLAVVVQVCRVPVSR